MHRFLGISLVVIAGCGGEKKVDSKPDPVVEDVKPTFRTERIECFTPAGAMGEGGRMDVGRRGPDECTYLMKAYLAHNATRHLVSVVPLEYPVEPSDRRELRDPGTQELVVTTADRGAWPLASDLEIFTTPCIEEHAGKPPTTHPRACLKILAEFTTEHTASWISLTRMRLQPEPEAYEQEDKRPYTVLLMQFAHRRQSSPGR